MEHFKILEENGCIILSCEHLNTIQGESFYKLRVATISNLIINVIGIVDSENHVSFQNLVIA